MADSNAQADIRGIDIDKVAKGFAEEVIQLKRFVRNSKTYAREIRWYSKTSGILDSVDTTGITASQLNTSAKSLPTVVEQSWTRNTSYVKHFFVESPWISEADIQDTDVDILTANVEDLVRAVAQQVNLRIWDVLSESQSAVNLNAVAITDEWDDYTNATPILDIMSAKRLIRIAGYNPEGAVLLLNDNEHKFLINWLISQKGASIPAFASDRVKDGVVMELLGCKVVVDQNVTADYAMLFLPETTATWKAFKEITSVVIEDKGIGRKVRVWEDGECILTDPKSGVLFSNVGPT